MAVHEIDLNASKKQKTPELALRSTLIANIALAILAVATGILTARFLGPAGEGELAAIQTWPLLLGTLAMIGLDSALVYFISREPDMGKQLTSTAALVGLSSAAIVGAAAWFALPLLLSAQQPQVVAAARVFLLIGVIYALTGIPHGSLRGANEFTSWNLFRIAPGLAWLCILVGSRLMGQPSAIPLSRWYLAGTLICGLPFLFVVNKRLRGQLKPDLRRAPEMLRFGLPSALTSLPQTINLRFDQLLIIALLPARSLGFYIVAVSWSGAVGPLLSALGAVLFPQVSAEPDTGRQGRLLATALQGGTLAGVATSATFMLLAPFCLPLIFGQSFAPSIPAAVMLVPAGAILGWAGIAEEGLRGLGRPVIVLAAEVVAAVITIAALPVLLHIDGIFGAALASLIGYSAIALFAAVAISRSTQQKIHTLIIPTWSTVKLVTTRSMSLLPGRYSQRGVNWAKI
jgi:O-antigen/teichoic acid export membrane protein